MPAAEEKTSSDITFTDSAGNPLMGAVELSGAGISSGLKKDVSYISWTNIPDAAIYFNVLDTKNVSVNLRIAGNSPESKVILDNFGIDLPKSVSLQAPGIPVKYVEISAFGVSFAEAEISIQYSDAEVKGLDEKTLAIYRYNGASQVWSELPTEIDAKNNILSATVNSLSVFAVSAGGQKIVVLDTKKTSVVSDIKTYDEAKNLRKKAEKTDTLLASDISEKGEVEIDALSSKNAAVKLKIEKASGGEVILDDYGKHNPVPVSLPGKAVKFVEIGASNVSYSSAEIKIKYSDAELNGADENSLVIYHWNGAAWEALPTKIDATNNLLTASTTSLSPFGVSATGGVQVLKVQTSRFSVFSPWFPATNKGSNLSGVFIAYALLIGTNGMPVSGANITFEIYSPAVKKATLFNISRQNGLANVSYDTLANNDFTTSTDADYGTWNVTAYLTSDSSVRGSINLSIQAGGSAIPASACGTREYCHNDNTTTQNFVGYPRSPYTEHYNQTFTRAEASHVKNNHVNEGCYYCHPGYSPNNKTGSYGNTSDVHRNRTCDFCHGNWAFISDITASGGQGIPRMPSCTDVGCHPLFNKNMTNISTMANLTAGANISVYSYNYDQRAPLTGHNNTGYSFNQSVPCLVCHGPAHNNTKPDPLAANTNNITEYTQCTSCHSAYQRHNNSVNCTVCHSQDAHIIRVFAQNATYINESTSSFRGNCTNCHQNSSFLSTLLVQPKAGAYTGRAPPQIPVPMNHSNDVNAGRKWNTTPGYWINGTSGSAQNSSCLYCHGRTMHNTSALGRPSQFKGSNTVNSTITASTSWCASCHWQGYSSGANNYNDTVSTFNFPSESLLVPPEITGNASFGANQSISGYTDHSTYAKDDTSCKTCHGSLLPTGTENITLFTHNVAVGVVGGANCTNCHNIGGTAGTGRLVNFSAMNSSDAIHKDLNSNATASDANYSVNKRCWACHGNGSEPAANEHPSNFRTPFNCTSCHVQSAEQNFNFTPNSTLLNVTQHYWNGSNITTANATSCYACHNRSEMMLGSFDPDGAGTVYSGANGGNNSTSHYGKKRSDLAGFDVTAYCSYCHNNETNNVTFFVSDFNNTIVNHSTRSTTPLCSNSTCHNTGKIHNVTLQKPVSNDSLCIICHGISGSAATNNKVRHKALNCTECHANASAGTLAGRDIHAIKYLTQGNSFATTNSSAVNCTTCHQTANVDSSLGSFSPFKIASPMHHSDNASNGSVWDSFWTNTTPQTACIYCHNNTIHNTTPLGRILLWAPDYGLYGAIGTNASCADCHYRNDANYTQMNSTFFSAGLNTPPEITNVTNWKGNSSNYYNHSLDAYDDSPCRNCHGSLLSVSANMSEFLHNVAVGVAGGANCTNCHNIGGTAGTGRLVNFTAMNSSDAIHNDLNRNAQVSDANYSTNRRCWACHGNGSEPPANEHPSNYKQPYNCTSCHVPSAAQNFNYTPNTTLLNVTQHYWNGSNITTANAASCYACHNRTEMMLGSFDPDGAATVYGGANGGNNSSSHYGRKRADLRINNVANCSYCHQNVSTAFAGAMLDSSYNSSISNHSRSNAPSCYNSTCHNVGWIHNDTLTRPPLPLPNTTYCQLCHDKQEHNATVQCSRCHINTTSNDTIHPIKFVLRNGSFAANNTTAANCTSCHQATLQGFGSAPVIPSVLKHSSNASNGTIWGSYWSTLDSSSCYYCHNDTKHNATALGLVNNLLNDPNNTRNGSLAITTWCADCHYNDSANAYYNGTRWTPQPPLITINNTGKSNWQNHSSFLSSGYKDSKCRECHALNGTYLGTSSNYSHSLDHGVIGGRNCTLCHDIGQSFPKVDVSKMNQSNSIHNYTNSNATASIIDNKRCWGCHTNSSVAADNVVNESELPENGHPDGFDNPRKCTQCHIDNKFGALVVSEHYTAGTDIRTRNYSNINDSCINCHNKTGMIISNNDPGGPLSEYANVSHYGDNKTGITPYITGSSANCSYCHQNATGAFRTEMIDAAWNSSINNHTNLGTNPGCTNSTCHNSGRIHVSSLAKPAVTSTLCADCHAQSKHNNTVECSRCHLETNRSIHPVQYLQPDSTFKINSIANRSTAVNCTDCHQSGLANFSSAPIIPAILKHSSNLSNGSIWNSTATPYWISGAGSCYYCHNNTKHNASALGRISSLLSDVNNTRNGSLAVTTWCADCHYNTSNPNYKGEEWTPVPPLITVNNTGKSFWQNHSAFLNSGYKDSNCGTCHALNGTYLATSLNYSHSLDEGGGGPNCISCHDVSGTGAPEDKRITASSIRQGVHGNLNSNATNSTSIDPINKACWACHGEGTEPSGHPQRYKTPRECSNNDCHSLLQSFEAPMVYSHFNDAELNSNPTNVTNFNVSAKVSCETCHSNSRSAENGNLNASVSHYATRDNLVDSMNCIYCHLNRDNSRDWGNATEINKNRSELIEFDRLRNKFTAYSGEFIDLGDGYRMRIAGVSPQRGSAIIEMYKGENIVDIGLLNIGRYVYEETRIIDNASSRVPVIMLNITSMFVPDTTGFIQFEGFRIKRVHPESRTTSCYLCHYQANATKHKFTVIDRVDKNVFYTEVLFNSSDRKEYDQQKALLILANKTPYDVRANIEGAKRKTLQVGEKWILAENYSLTLKNVAENSDSASLLLEAGGENFTDIVKRGEIFDYEPRINYLGYADTKIVIFRANVSEISQNIVVLEDITALSPEIIKIDINSTIYGYNASWLWKNNTFMTGMIPSDLHAPLLYDGSDGGAACTSCHSVGELGAHKDVNSPEASSASPENKACWACHGDGKEPKWHPANYKNPRNCKSCHVERIVPFFNATYIGDEKHGALVNCNQCHVEDTHKTKRFAVAPGIRRLSVSKEVVYAGEKITIGATAAAGYEMRIRSAEYYIDTPDKLIPLAAADGSFDEQIEEVTAEINTSGLKTGNHLIYVRAMERDNKWGPESSISVSVEEKTPTAIDRIIEKTPALIKTPLQKIVESKSPWVNFSVALILFGFALYKLIQYKKALRGYEKVKKMIPETADEWYNRGFDLYKLGNYEGAIKAYDKALDITRKMRNLTNNRQK